MARRLGLQLDDARTGLMAKILYITTGMTSMVNAGIALADRLRTRGHEVAFASHRDCSQAVGRAGFDFTHLVRDQDFLKRFTATDNPATRLEIRKESLHNTEIEELVEQVEPDALLIDMELHYAMIVTRSSNLPTLIPIVWYSVFQSPTNPPLHTSFTPDDGLKARAAWLLLWASRTRRHVVQRLRRYLRRDPGEPLEYSCRSRADLAQLARSRGLSLRRITKVYEWLNPHTYTDIDVMSYNPVEMEFAPQDHPRLHHVGPMVNDAGGGNENHDEWTDYVRTRDEERPLIYCSLGSFWATDLGFLNGVIDVFRKRSDWDLVIGLGGKSEPESFENVPENVLLLSWAPQVEILRHASAAITHGGISTINECIDNGVPMVGYSTGRVDQNGCVARFVYHGLGIAGDRKNDGPSEIEACVEALLTDRTYRARCDEMARVFADYRQSAQAEELIESMLT